MNKKIINIVKIIFIFFSISIIMLSFVVSQDEHHIDTCNDEHCIYCLIINISQSIFNLLITFIYVISFKFFIKLLLSRMHKEKIGFMQSSLVFQNIQLNE